MTVHPARGDRAHAARDRAPQRLETARDGRSAITGAVTHQRNTPDCGDAISNPQSAGSLSARAASRLRRPERGMPPQRPSRPVASTSAFEKRSVGRVRPRWARSGGGGGERPARTATETTKPQLIRGQDHTALAIHDPDRFRSVPQDGVGGVEGGLNRRNRTRSRDLSASLPRSGGCRGSHARRRRPK